MSVDTSDFVHWFRSAAPYIHAHRGKTFVLHFGGELTESAIFPHLIHDIALLNSLGIRLVIVYGARPQIEGMLAERDIKARFVNGLRVTDESALAVVKQAVGAVRIQIEALLSMGLTNSPMADARIKVSSGNFITAKPIGVINGMDLEFTGTVRRINADLINHKLDNHEIVLVAPLGYSPTGEVFNLGAVDVATQIAISLQSDKLLFLMSGNGIKDQEDDIVQQLTQDEAEKMLAGKDLSENSPFVQLSHGLRACQKGVKRIHFIDQDQDGGLLLELFSRDGIGTMLSAMPFDQIRPATIEDIGGIIELIQPFEEQTVLVRRSREKMEMEIADYTVLIRDGAVIGCAALYAFPKDSAAELACFVIHPDYQNEGRGNELFNWVEKKARNAGLEQVFLLTTQAEHWFLEHGFNQASLDDLPVSRKLLYNYQRNSKVLIKRFT